MERHRYAQIAAIVFGAGAIEEAARVVLDRPWKTFTPEASHVVSILLVLAWGGAAATLLLRRHSKVLVAASWLMSITGGVALLFHAIFVATFSRAPVFAVALFAATGAAAFCTKRAFDRGLLRHREDLDPHRV